MTMEFFEAQGGAVAQLRWTPPGGSDVVIPATNLKPNFDCDRNGSPDDCEPDGDAEFTTQFIGTETEYDRESEPVTDAGGKPLDVTRRYSSDVGKVLATVKGTTAVYRLTGRELYVRATVTSSKPADNPAFKGQLKQAWTQPVGWKKHVAADRSQRR